MTHIDLSLYSGRRVAFQGQPPNSAIRNCPPRDESIDLLLAGLHIGVPVQGALQTDGMFIRHMYAWDEAIPPADEQAQSNVRLRRLSIDILLPGPTDMSQIKAIVNMTATKLNMTYSPPQTFLSPERTMVRLATGALGATAASNTGIRGTMHAAARVQAHRNALETLRTQHATQVYEIDLPFPCDHHFCRRDDWGYDNRCNGIDIGLYQHENMDFRTNNQYVWILHVELSARERPNVAPISPAGFNIFNA